MRTHHNDGTVTENYRNESATDSNLPLTIPAANVTGLRDD